MYQIDNVKFGMFLAEIRKEKNLTQKELGEQLFVSDKTVSKWERGAGMPNVVLLIPIADALDITVTEFLRGERIDGVKGKDQSVLKQYKKNWVLAYIFCLFITIAEVVLLAVLGIPVSEMYESILLVSGLALLFGAWFCLFAKELLPKYYDENKINYVSQGIFRVHMAGLSFNNGNWPYICTVFKVWSIATAVLYPLICIVTLVFADIRLWNDIKNIVTAISLIGMAAAVYIVGKKYEN